jgi:hypothetical protein
MIRLIPKIASEPVQGEYDSVCFAGAPWGKIEPCKSTTETIHVLLGYDCLWLSDCRLALIERRSQERKRL